MLTFAASMAGAPAMMMLGKEGNRAPAGMGGIMVNDATIV